MTFFPVPVGLRPAFMRAISLPARLAILLAVAAAPCLGAEDTAADAAARALLDVLEDRQMADVALTVIRLIEADPAASDELKREAAFRRAAALIGVSRTEADGGKRAKYLDDAQASLDTFLKSGAISDRQAIAAYTQKGNLLVERGRVKAEQANRPGADAESLRAEAVAFFDQALQSLKGKAKAGEPITELTNAEDAVIKVLREVDAKVDALKAIGKEEEPAKEEAEPPAKDEKEDKDGKGKGKGGAPGPGRGKPLGPKGKSNKDAKLAKLTPAQRKELETLEADQEGLRAKLIQTRLTAAAAMFEKAKAFPADSKERTETLTKSAEMFRDVADKYPTKGGGFFARYYEGRNYAMLGKWEDAINTLSGLVTLEQKIPLAIRLRSMSLNTSLESMLALKKYEGFDASARKFALEDVKKLPGTRLDAEWLGLKYRAALVLQAQAEALDPADGKTKTEKPRMLADAKKLAVEVARANADFADEARELASKFGQVVAEGEKTFANAMDEAKVVLSTMQAKAAEAKAAVAAGDAEAEAKARKDAAAARAETVVKLEEALTIAGIKQPLAADPAGDDKLTGEATIEDVNQARYLLTFLLFEGERFDEAATMGRMLTDRYPNAKGSRQAAKIAMAAWQQVGQKAEGQAREDARAKTLELAGIVMKTWPEESESADAALIVIGAAVTARDPAAIVPIIAQVPASAPRRAEVLLRAGVSLWREVQESRRQEEGVRPSEEKIQTWKEAARKSLDDGLAAIGTATSLPPPPLGQLAAAGALSRVQIALEDADEARAVELLKHPVYGPWTLVSGDTPALTQGQLAEAALTLALRMFIQLEDFDNAQKAMQGLEKVAGKGEEASAKLTAMYLSMGRDLQGQLESLGGGGKALTPEVRARADKILVGFEKFLDSIAARDDKISSQIWVATTYLTLGSGKGTGAIVPPAKAAAYLKKSADVYQKLLANKDNPEVARFEPSVRLKMATIYKELGAWDDAQEQINWILADAKRQNSLEAQIEAAEILQAAGRAAVAAGEADKANDFLRDAAGGRRGQATVIWGWGNIANKIARAGLAGTGDKAQQSRDTFFNARLRVVECLLLRAKLPGKEAEKTKRLETAEAAIAMTRKLYPDMGGEAFAKRYERLLKEVQKERGKEPTGFAALDEQAARSAPPVEQGAAGGAP